MLRAGTDPTPAPDCVGEPLVVPHLGETQRPLATHAHRQRPAAGVWFLHIHNLEEHQQTRQSLSPLLSISMQKAFQEPFLFFFWQCFQEQSNVAFVSHYLSHWNDDMALASVLAGETQVVLRQADLSKGVVVAEGHPQETLVHLQQVFLFGEPEKRPELVALCVSL